MGVGGGGGGEGGGGGGGVGGGGVGGGWGGGWGLFGEEGKVIYDIGTEILIFTRIFTTDMFINSNLTIFGATATDFPPLSNPLGPRA